MIRERYGRLPGRLEEEEEVSRALSKAITHAHDHFLISKRYGHIHQSKKDAQRWNILFQLLTILPAVKYKRTHLKDVGKRTERILQALEEEHGEPVFYYRMEDDVPRRKYIVLPPYDPREGKLIPSFEKLKKDPEFRKKFIDLFLDAHEMSKTLYGEKMEKYLPLAIEAAEEVAEFLGEEGKAVIKVEDLERLKKLTDYLDTIMRKEFYLRPVEKKEERKPAAPAPEQAPQVHEPAKPKYPETKKAVEEEPKKADIIKLEAQKLLGLLQGLKLANYSESVVENAKAELDKELDRLAENPENLELIGLYALILKLLEKKDFEKAERILKEIIEH